MNARVPWGKHDSVLPCLVDAELDAKVRGKHRRLLDRYCGQAIPLARRAVVETALLFVISPIVTVIVSIPVSGRLAGTPAWLLPALSLGILRLCWLEHKVRKLVLPEIARLLVDSPPTVLGLKVPCCWWVVFITCITFTSHLDVVTSGIFLGRWMHVLFHGDRQSFALWSWIMQYSCASFLASIPFPVYVALAYLLMAFQGVYAFRESWPLPGQTVANGLEESLKIGFTYKTRSHDSCNHTLAMVPLMEVARMTSLIDSFKAAWNNELEFKGKGLYRLQIPYLLGGRLRQVSRKLALFSLLQGGLTLNLEVTGLALARAVDGRHRIDGFTLASIASGIFVGCYTVLKELQYATHIKGLVASVDFARDCRQQFAKNVRKNMQAVEPLLAALDAGESLSTIGECTDAAEELWIRAGVKNQRSACRDYVFVISVVVLYLLVVALATYRTIMVLKCPTGLHNLGVGCLALPPNLTSA